MGWEWMLVLLIGSMLVLMATGMPVAFAFMSVVIVGAFLLFGGSIGLEQLIDSIYASLAQFTLLPIALFILMGELMTASGIALKIIDVLNKLFGRVPGRLSLLAVGAGTLLSTLTGASMASVAILGSVLVPEMRKRGYSKVMSLGPILGSGGLAVMIPPSGLAIILGAIGEISIGKILIAIVVPGILLACVYTGYIIFACWRKPSLAPSYDLSAWSVSERLKGLALYVAPTGIIVFLVLGLIFFGVATPEESAASGTLGLVILLFFYRKLKWGVIKSSLLDTLRITGMVYLIIAAAQAFSEILSFSGATQGLVQFGVSLHFPRIFFIIAIQLIILVMGCFMDPVSIMMITLPIFVPFIISLHFDKVWFAVITLLNIEMAMITPPFGMSLFVMKGVVPSDTSIEDIYRAVVPFILCNIFLLGLLIAFPRLSLWLPSISR